MKSILALFLVVLFASCQNGSRKERIVSTDTVRHVVALQPDNKIQYFAKGIIAVRDSRKLPTDSTSSNVEWSRDTVLSEIYAPIDTLRDVKRHPIYDSLNKRYKFDSGWQKVPNYDPKQVQIRYFK